MNKQHLMRALLPALIALALAARVDAAQLETQAPAAAAKRDAKVIQAEMQQLGQRMTALATELRAQGGEFSPEAMQTTTILRQMHEGAALGIVLSARESGIFISAVTPGSGAEQAGLHSGDQIISVRDKAIAANTSVEAVRTRIGTLKAGDTVALGIKRGGQMLTLTAKATQQPRVLMFGAHDAKVAAELRALELETSDLAIQNRFNDEGAGEHRRIKIIRNDGQGVSQNSDLDLSKITPDLGSYFGTATGVLALSVQGYAPLLPGDVILRVGNVATTSPGEVFAQFGAAQGKAVEVAVMRQKAPRTLTVQVPIGAMPPVPPMPPAPPKPPLPPIPPAPLAPPAPPPPPIPPAPPTPPTVPPPLLGII